MTPLVCLVAGAVFFAGSLFPPGSVAAGSPMAALLALGPIAGIMVQVIIICCCLNTGHVVYVFEMYR
jgi:hypothetical protein